MPPPHPPEFRRRAVELARSTPQPVAELARDLGMSESCRANSMAKANIDAGRGHVLPGDEGVDLRVLRVAGAAGERS